MDKRRLTEDEYIAELNRQLKQHEYYKDGMEFLPYPANATGKNITGYSVKGPFKNIGVFAQVAHKVSEGNDLKT